MAPLLPTISNIYASLHESPNGPGDARPTAFQIIKDNDLIGKLSDKVFLVTGGTNGLGVDVVRQLAKTGATVFFTARDAEKGEKVKQDILEVILMDLRNLQSVKKGAEDFMRRSENLNVLVNNAGIALTPYGLTEDGFEQQFGVNHLAHFYLFQLLKPLLLRSSSAEFNSRIISVSSSAHTFGSVFIGNYNLENIEGGYTPFAGYAAAKTANIWFATELERRYGRQGLHGISVHPGGILTGLQRYHDPSIVPMLEQYLKMDHISKAMKSIEQGAATTVLAAVGRSYEGKGGFYMEDCGISSPMPDDAPMGSPGFKPWAYEEEGEKQLWVDSLNMIGMKEDTE
ncbi:hypothetical protein M433DRAFT_113631 [Acidomyces richmondensis BFW]|nr:MAG: hypothetical protein FE78DRAFT_157485 [Acidomyces sp. 'richmondensis']KYG42629.1 hypothetical protein M433DRAFT_113631 [Acidomyces richmondensis BFW]